MPSFPIHVAKTHLSRLIAQALEGDDVVISRGPVPVVRLVPVQPVRKERVPGSLKGILVVGPEFFEPLPEEELASWGS